MMRRLSILLLTFFSIIGVAEMSRAQEAVSTTSGGGGSTETSAPSSTTSTTEVSAPSTSGAVTNAPSATTSVQGGPSGVGVFSPTPVQIYAGVFGGYDDNVNTTRFGPKQGSAFTGGNVVLDYTFGDPRLQIILNLGGGGSYYFDELRTPAPAGPPGPTPTPTPTTTQNYDIDFKAAVGITYKSSPRLTLGGTALLDYLTEPNFDNPGGLNSRNGNYFYTTDNVFATFAWSRRFNTKTSYTFETYQYDSDAVGIFSNRVSNTFGNEFRFQMVPTTVLIAEYRYGIVSYQHEGEVIVPAVFIGPFQISPPVFLENDSTTHFALLGIDHTFNPRFNGSLRGGAEFRSYDAGGDRSGPYLEGTLNYAVGRRTSVGWSARYGLEEPEIPGAQSRTTFRTGLHGKFDLTSRVSSTLDAFYTHDDYHSISTTLAPFSEDTFDIGIGVHYAITPLFGVQAGYHYTDIISDAGSREYSRNRVSGGVSLKF